MQKYNVMDAEAHKQELYSKIEHLEADNAALREQVKRLSTCGTDHSTPWWQVRCEDLEAERDALRLKVQELTKFYDKHVGTPCEQIRHQQEVETLNERLDAYRKDLTTLETLVKALPKIKGTIFETVASCRGEGGPESWVRFEVALAALLTHRQGMGG